MVVSSWATCRVSLEPRPLFDSQSSGEKMPLITLYVGNLPWETTPEELEQIFGEFGEVRAARVIMDNERGRSKGYGFVEMPMDAALEAQDRIHGAKLRGRNLVVSPAKTDPRRDDAP
jgi:RNA recognition motif-containing protein